jgi:hypothetical protein
MDSIMDVVATKYAAYKLAAVDAVLRLHHKNTDPEVVYALAALQDFVN